MKIKASVPPYVPYKKGPGLAEKKRKTLMKCFVADTSARKAAEIAEVHRNTADLWYRRWREKIYRASARAPRFSGEIQIDQHEFGGMRKKKSSALVRQLAGLPAKDIIERGKQLKRAKKATKYKVFGILRTGGDVYAHLIPDESARTLIPILHLVVEKGSTIFSDQWAAFNSLKLDGYRHTAINHSVEYVDKKGRHINGIESFWSWCDSRLHQFKGFHRSTIPLHIKECEFRFNHRKDIKKALRKILI